MPRPDIPSTAGHQSLIHAALSFPSRPTRRVVPFTRRVEAPCPVCRALMFTVSGSHNRGARSQVRDTPITGARHDRHGDATCR